MPPKTEASMTSPAQSLIQQYTSRPPWSVHSQLFSFITYRSHFYAPIACSPSAVPQQHVLPPRHVVRRKLRPAQANQSRALRLAWHHARLAAGRPRVAVQEPHKSQSVYSAEGLSSRADYELMIIRDTQYNSELPLSTFRSRWTCLRRELTLSHARTIP